MRRLYKAVKKGFFAFLDEIKRHMYAVYCAFQDACANFLSAGITKKLIDIFLAMAICIASPLVGIGIATANFIDVSDTLTAAISAVVALIALEFLSFWSMELIVILVAFQLSRFTKRVVQNYDKRVG